MSIQERQAWFMLTAITGALLAVGVLAALLGWRAEVLGGLAVLGVGGFTPLIGRKEARSGRVVQDERDDKIGRDATLASYSVFWGVFVLATVLPLLFYGPDHVFQVPTTVLSMMVPLGMVMLFAVRSVVTIVLYRWS